MFGEPAAANGNLFLELDAPTPLHHRKSHQGHRKSTVAAGARGIVKEPEFDLGRLARVLPEPPIRPKPIPTTADNRGDTSP